MCCLSAVVTAQAQGLQSGDIISNFPKFSVFVATPVIRCTHDEYCRSRLKSTKAKCTMPPYTCACDANDTYSSSSDGCGTVI